MRPIRNAMQRAVDRVRAVSDGEPAAPAQPAPAGASSSAVPRRSWLGSLRSAPRQSPVTADPRLADVLTARPGAEPLEHPEPLRRLLSKPASARLVDMLHQDKAQVADPDDPTLVECLARRPGLMAVLERSPRLVDEACSHADLLEAALTQADPSAALVDEPVLRTHVERLRRSFELQRRTSGAPDAGLMQRHGRTQAEWMQALLGKSPTLDGSRSITQTISLLQLPGAECFATGCPRRTGESLPDFLTLAARQDAVIVSLMSASEFAKPNYADDMNFMATGTHESAGIRWSSRAVEDNSPAGWPVPWEGPSAQTDLSRHALDIHLPGTMPARQATVLQFHQWPDAGTADPEKLDRLLDAVDAELDQRRQRAGDASPAHPGLMVHCHFGIERTSVFCAMLALRDAHRKGRPADVEGIVAELRAIRGGNAMKPFSQVHQMAMVLAYADRLDAEANRPRT